MDIVILSLLGLFATAWLALGVWHACKPLPAALHVDGPWREARGLRLLLDETFFDARDRRHCRQAIFDEWFRLIGQARRLVVIDMFQFNDPADTRDCYRAIAGELCDALLRRKAEVPDIEIVLITDPFNGLYGGRRTPHLETLARAGIRVVISDLAPGRDPNPSWSGLWRLALRWFGNSPRGAWLPNPAGPGRVTLRSYLALLNFNANHRKTLIVDRGDGWAAVVGSANADDGSSAYRDAALRFAGPAALDLLAAELDLARLSGLALPVPCPRSPPVPTAPPSLPRLRVLTEGAIRDALLALVEDARHGEHLDISVLYLAHRPLIAALKTAHRRGVAIRLLLDPNQAHFGRPSPGIPNRQTAWELDRAGLAIRWWATRGDHGHSKVLLRHGGSRPANLLLGSANYTRRSLDDYNLEADVQLHADTQHPVIREARASFERHWHNRDSETVSRPYAEGADASTWRYWRYRLMEASGWSLF